MIETIWGLERGQKHGFNVTCDKCGVVKQCMVGDNWGAMLKEIRGAGWKNEKKDDRWEHYCDVCVDKSTD
jgi:hypothetical protein